VTRCSTQCSKSSGRGDKQIGRSRGVERPEHALGYFPFSRNCLQPSEFFVAEAFTGTEGYLGVLANHAGLVTALASGTLTVRLVGGAEERWQVSGGFFEVSNNKASVLADAVGAAKG
jgi:hypothetical protein